MSQVLKPDHAARRRHFIFDDEHDALRESIRAFVDREVVPHVEEWEETTFPDAIVERMGDLGFLGLSMPEEYGGQGGDYFANLVLAEEIARSGSGGSAHGPVGPHRHGHAADPRVRHRGAEAGDLAAPASPASRSTASASPSPTRAPTSPASARAPSATATSWVINGAKTLHHQRRTAPT